MSRRTFADVLLFGVTSAELALLFVLTPTFTVADWIYVGQNLVVLAIAVARGSPAIVDRSVATGIAVVTSYAYPYAQVAYLWWIPGQPVWLPGGFVLLVLAACLSLASLLALGRRFGVRPALRGLTTKGPYRLVRHPMLSGVRVGRRRVQPPGIEPRHGRARGRRVGGPLYRIRAEERMLSHHPGWPEYAASVRHRWLPGVW